MKTLCLVDDDADVRRALSRVLRAAGFAVEAFDSAETFLARPRASQAHCVVLDIAMPGLDGLALQQHLAASGAAPPIVFLTGQGDMPTCVQAMKRGAADFLTKPVDMHTLVEAVRAAIERGESEQAAHAEVHALEARYEQLTEREREVLVAVLAGKLNKQIASDLHVVEQTVKFHRARLMERMQARTVAELVLMAARIGVAPTPHPAPHPVAAPKASCHRAGPAITSCA